MFREFFEKYRNQENEGGKFWNEHAVYQITENGDIMGQYNTSIKTFPSFLIFLWRIALCDYSQQSNIF